MAVAEAFEILIVEDNPPDLEMTLRGLRKANIANRIHVARGGAEALEFLFCEGAYADRRTEDAPRFVLLDLKLPKVDSSKEQRDLIERYQLGVNRYIVKPVDFENFVQAARELGSYWLMLNPMPAP